MSIKHVSRRYRVRVINVFLMIMLSGIVACDTFERVEDPEFFPRFYLSTHGTEHDRLTTTATMPVSGLSLYVQSQPVFYEGDVMQVDLVKVDLGYCAMFQFNAAATRTLYRIAVANQGRKLLLFINGEPVGLRVIDQYFETGSVMMFLEMPNRSVPEYVAKLQESVARIQKAKEKLD